MSYNVADKCQNVAVVLAVVAVVLVVVEEMAAAMVMVRVVGVMLGTVQDVRVAATSSHVDGGSSSSRRSSGSRRSSSSSTISSSSITGCSSRGSVSGCVGGAITVYVSVGCFKCQQHAKAAVAVVVKNIFGYSILSLTGTC